ncbi:MAG TPA: tetratricopeptide repeat protein [Hyphomicrobiaceae bacterium]|nr:tetratricopeptide repeat protein [Hyphomicrobiaceae bacterium]
MADDQQALLRQIDEELRREQWAKLWDKYGVIALGAVAAVLAVYGGWRFYQYEATKAAQRYGAQFAEAGKLLTEKKDADALRGLEKIAKEGPSGYAALAKLKLAGEARKAGKTEDAVKLYQELAAQSGGDAILKSFAKLQIAWLKVDTASWTEMKNQLNDLAQETSPWRYSARELLGLAAYKAGEYAEARKAYQELLGASGVPQPMAQRAQIAMALVTREELKKSGGAAAATQPAAKDGAAKPGDAKTKK